MHGASEERSIAMRLIDADALGIVEAEKEAYNGFVEHSKKNRSTSSPRYFYLKGRSDGLIEASGRVKFAPTIDAVPVVRCRECVYYNTTGCSDGFGWCEDSVVNTGTHDDFFCARGKRREDGDT